MTLTDPAVSAVVNQKHSQTARNTHDTSAATALCCYFLSLQARQRRKLPELSWKRATDCRANLPKESTKEYSGPTEIRIPR